VKYKRLFLGFVEIIIYNVLGGFAPGSVVMMYWRIIYRRFYENIRG
jgi:hypothetical protein